MLTSLASTVQRDNASFLHGSRKSARIGFPQPSLGHVAIIETITIARDMEGFDWPGVGHLAFPVRLGVPASPKKHMD